MSDSSHKFIKRNRPPRVHITYEDPYDAERKIELPFVMGVMSDLSGNASSVEKQDVAERKFVDFDMDNFEQRMAAIASRLAELGTAFSQHLLADESSFVLPPDGEAHPAGLPPFPRDAAAEAAAARGRAHSPVISPSPPPP